MTKEDDVCPIKFKIIVNGKCVVCGKDLTENRIFICEECAKENNFATDFCPHCGADMRGDKK